MKIPQLIMDSIVPLRNLVGNIDEIALVNVLNAKLANMITQSNVVFKQYSNSSDRVLSYYAINFMNSGENKDYIVSIINDYLIPFVADRLQDKVDDYRSMFELQLTNEYDKATKKKVQQQIDDIRIVNHELFNPNYTGLYREAEQIDKVGFGSLFIRIEELGDYLDNIVSGNQSKKELYQKLKDIYEGTIAPNIIAGDGGRKLLKNISVQVLMYTDYANLLNDKIKRFYITSLKTGLARRCFIYMPLTSDKKLSYPPHPQQSEEAINQLLQLQQRYKYIFDVLDNKTNNTYVFTEDAQQCIYQYQCNCIDQVNQSNDDIIIKLELKSSFWKITKLAVIYSIVDNPTSNVVTQKYVDMAISFYQAIHPSLKTVIETREKSEVEKYAKYMYDHREKPITVMQLRKLAYIRSDVFRSRFTNMLDDIKEELSLVYGCDLYDYNGNKNSKGFIIKER